MLEEYLKQSWVSGRQEDNQDGDKLSRYASSLCHQGMEDDEMMTVKETRLLVELLDM